MSLAFSGTVRAQTLIVGDHVESYAATWAKLVGLDARVSETWLASAHITLTPIDDAVIADEQTTIDLYKDAGLIPVRLVANDLVGRSFGDAIAGMRATVR